MPTKLYLFDELSFKDKIAHFNNVAQQALSKWGFPANSKLKLLNYTENATFLVEWENNKVIMRVHRLYYATKDSINTELSWIVDLSRSTDLDLALPIKSLSNNYVETIDTPALKESRHVVCFKYAEGKAPVDSSDDTEQILKLMKVMNKIPNFITVPIFKIAAIINAQQAKKTQISPLTQADRNLYKMLGKIAATIHKQSENWQAPSYYSRMEWNYDGTFGEHWNNFYGMRYKDVGCLSKKDIKLLDECAKELKDDLENYGKGKDRYGMIHSDLRMSNILQSKDKITILDFDDCGKGWYVYDIAGIVGLMEHRVDLNEVVREVIEGYESVRQLTIEDKEEIKTFIMLRRMGMLQSIGCRMGNVMPGDGESLDLTIETLAFYAKGTVEMAKNYINEHKQKEEAKYKMNNMQIIQQN